MFITDLFITDLFVTDPLITDLYITDLFITDHVHNRPFTTDNLHDGSIMNLVCYEHGLL